MKPSFVSPNVRLSRAERRFEVSIEPVGGRSLPCRGQEAPQRALKGSVRDGRASCQLVETGPAESLTPFVRRERF